MSFEIFFFTLAAIVAFMPTFWDMKVKGKKLNWWTRLTLAGRIYIIAFASFFGSGLYLTIKSHNESVVKETESKEKIKSDSLLMSSMSVRVNKLYLSDSSQRIKNDSLKRVITSINKQVIQSGGSGLQNNAANYGIQAARDVNIGNEIELSQQDLDKILQMVSELVKKYDLVNGVLFMTHPLSNGKKASLQLSKFLKKNGFNVNTSGISGGEITENIIIGHDLDEKMVIIRIGELK